MVTAPGSHVVIPADKGEVVVLALPPTSPGWALFPSNVSPGKDVACHLCGLTPQCPSLCREAQGPQGGHSLFLFLPFQLL